LGDLLSEEIATMASVIEQAGMTTQELLALPENGVERWLIDGELREKPMTVRNRFHSSVMSVLSYFLVHWNRNQPVPRGEVVSGEAGFRLARTPDSTVGVDVAYAPPELSSLEVEGTKLFDGPPLLAVEILSPNDTQEQVFEKVKKYLDSGTKLVWVVDPDYPTVTVHEAGREPVLYNREHEVSGDPYLPGLRVPVKELLG
jgi:Uma2 family endonuclease